MQVFRLVVRSLLAVEHVAARIHGTRVRLELAREEEEPDAGDDEPGDETTRVARGSALPAPRLLG